MSLLLFGEGFLPTRGSFMLDFVVVAMIGVTIALLYSIFQAKSKRNYSLHRTVQASTAFILLIALVAFEVDMQLITDWRKLAKASPYYESGLVNWSLWIHLMFAIPTPFIWGGVIWFAFSRFKESFSVGQFNAIHRRWGWIAAIMMLLTSVTGWVFYYLAFVA